MNIGKRMASGLFFMLTALGLAACGEREADMSGEPATVARIEARRCRRR